MQETVVSVESKPLSRPRWMLAVSICLALGVASGPIYQYAHVSHDIWVLCLGMSLAMLWVVYRFWMGKKWARRLVMCGCLAAPFQLIVLSFPTRVHELYIVTEVAVAAVIFAWLWTPQVRQYFKEKYAADQAALRREWGMEPDANEKREHSQ